MEVIIAVILISIVGTTLLKLNSNNTSMIAYSSTKDIQNRLFSLFAVNGVKDQHNKKIMRFKIKKE